MCEQQRSYGSFFLGTFLFFFYVVKYGMILIGIYESDSFLTSIHVGR